MDREDDGKFAAANRKIIHKDGQHPGRQPCAISELMAGFTIVISFMHRTFIQT
jgi:hypothetical protein